MTACLWHHPVQSKQKASENQTTNRTTTPYKPIKMRAHVLSLSANTALLRQALPVLVRPHNKSTLLLRTTAPNCISFLRSTSQTTPFRHIFSTPKCHDILLSTTSLRNFTSRATHVNDAGSFDLPLIQSMQNKVSFPLLSC